MTFFRKISRLLAALALLLCLADYSRLSAEGQKLRNKSDNLYSRSGNRQSNLRSDVQRSGYRRGEYGLPELEYEEMQSVCMGATRAVGVKNSRWSDAPFMVSIRDLERDRAYYGSGHLCGGTIISPYLVLTAAGCTRAIPQERMGVVIGSLTRKMTATNTTQLNFVNHIFEHPSFSEDKGRFDIALLVLKAEAPIGRRVKTARLPARDPMPGQSCSIYGWGSTEQEERTKHRPVCLEMAQVEIQDQNKCSTRSLQLGVRMPLDTICAASRIGGDVGCSRDVGGPLVCNGVVHGIATSRAGCGERNVPAYYTDISRYRYWILQTIKDRLSSIKKEYPKGSFDVQF